MQKYISLFMTLPLCVLLFRYTLAESADGLNTDEDGTVKVALTSLAVNDQNLEIAWKIMNNSDHDVWICDGYIDKFMDVDNKTLVLRMRYNLSKEGIIWEFPFPRFRYTRLRPGQEKDKSLSLPVPVEPSALFKTSLGNAEVAQRLIVEIGFYDEDLAQLIVDIAELAQKLGCDLSVSSPIAISVTDPDERTMQLRQRFFEGTFIARGFYMESFEYFRNSVTSGGDEIIAPYLSQTLNGERTLRIEVDNVSIPYKSNYPPLAVR